MIKSNLLSIPAMSSQFQASQGDLVILETLAFCATLVLSLAHFAQLLDVHSHQEPHLSPSILTFEKNVKADDDPDSDFFRTELPSSTAAFGPSRLLPTSGDDQEMEIG